MQRGTRARNVFRGMILFILSEKTGIHSLTERTPVCEGTILLELWRLFEADPGDYWAGSREIRSASLGEVLDAYLDFVE